MITCLNKFHVLLVVENCAVPEDYRVWKQALALKEKGYSVSVICPRGVGRFDSPYEELEGIKIYRFKTIVLNAGTFSYIVEYLNAFIKISLLAVKLYFTNKFHVLHVGNPPDIFFPLFLVCRILGVKTIFDQHDICPEFYQSKYPDKKNKLLLYLLKLMEKLSYKTANAIIVTNESYRLNALNRGKVSSRKVYIVRNGPKPLPLSELTPNPALKQGNNYLVCFFGVMGEHDGLDHLCKSISYIVNVEQRDDILFAFIGPTDLERSSYIHKLYELVNELAIEEYVKFTGFLPWPDVHRYLATADVCVSPDPKVPSNDVSTMIKVLEYMAHAKPIVSYNLQENRFSAKKAALYIKNNDFIKFGERILFLLERRDLRLKMGMYGFERVGNYLSWEQSLNALFACYQSIVSEDWDDEQYRESLRI